MSTHKNFLQSGALHGGAPSAWDRIAASTPVTTMEVMSKFAAANIHPYIGHIGEFLAEQFKFAAHGTQYASYGYNNLGVAAMSSLVFGFGPDHIIRVHADNTGFVFLIIIGALMEYYHQNFIALVFYEMTLDLGIPPHLLASPAHWRGPMNAFNGVLVNTKFGILVDELVRLNPYREPIVKQKAESLVARFGARPSSPKSVAKVLRALGALSKGGSETLTIMGSEEGALFAAMADWLFGLRMVIRTDSGQELRSNCEGQEPQVVVVFTPAAKKGSPQSGVHQMQLTGLICRLEPDLENVAGKEGSLDQVLPVSPGGRIFWRSLAIDVYGSDFMDLLRTSSSDIHFGAAIGSAARVFEGIVEDSKESSTGAFSWRSATPSSYGLGLIQTLIAYFPDMSRARPRMEKPLRMSFAEARSHYEMEIAKLIAYCDCAICHIGDDSPKHHRSHCLVVIVESTVALGLLLAKTVVGPEVYPKRAGLEGFYHFWAQARQDLNGKRAEIPEKERFDFIYRPALLMLKGGVVLSASVCLFSATLPDIPDPNALAYSCNGIVAYSGLLHRSLGYRKTWDTSTRVMAGGIQYHGRVYKSVVADAVLMEKIEKGEILADDNIDYEIVEPQDHELPLVLRLIT